MAGISSEEIIKFINKRQKLKKNFCGVFAVDELIEDFVKCTTNVFKKSEEKLPFAVANTDPISKGGTHWFSLMKLQDKNSFFLFDSFGLMGLSYFVISDDDDLVSAFLRNLQIEEMDSSNDIKFYSFTFYPDIYLSITPREREQLSETCLGLLNFFTSFAIALGATQTKVHGVSSQLQLKETSTCGVFQLFLLDKTYENVDESICKLHRKCTIGTLRDILNLYFTAGSVKERLTNEHKISKYAKQTSIKGEF